MRGFSVRNLWRMKQFYETYHALPKLTPLVTELSWTHNLLIMSRSRRDEEREFYLRLCIREKWSKRELERRPGLRFRFNRGKLRWSGGPLISRAIDQQSGRFHSFVFNDIFYRVVRAASLTIRHRDSSSPNSCASLKNSSAASGGLRCSFRTSARTYRRN